jgi:8-oxo-dGTP pyrophosphatase MutT (NUDIX family)
MDVRTWRLQQVLAVHVPSDGKEHHDVAVVRRYLSWLRQPFAQEADPTHVTASAVVLNRSGDVLVHRHKRLGVYLQPGGHIDGNESPEQAATRELFEETGVTLDVGPLVHVDVHQGPRGHVHLDLRYLFVSEQEPIFRPLPGESTDVRFLAVGQIGSVADQSLQRAVMAATRTH